MQQQPLRDLVGEDNRKQGRRQQQQQHAPAPWPTQGEAELTENGREDADLGESTRQEQQQHQLDVREAKGEPQNPQQQQKRGRSDQGKVDNLEGGQALGKPANSENASGTKRMRTDSKKVRGVSASMGGGGEKGGGGGGGVT